VPVLPDLARRLHATPTVIGFLFGSFGVTLLVVSIPMGAASDRFGRKAPMVGGLLALGAASAAFAVGDNLLWLFTARLIQGAADGVTWVVGFALIADLYEPAERGRITGLVLAFASFAYMLGPSIGGWLYELGGIRMPFLALALLALPGAIGFLLLRLPVRRTEHERVPVAAIVRAPEVAACTGAVLAIASTMSMLEPVLALYLQTRLGIGPARVGLVFAAAAVANMGFHPLFGHLADRWGARRLTFIGMFASAAMLPFEARAWSFESAIVLNVLQAGALAIVVTPSLSFMAAAVSSVGLGSFGVAYGLYNMAWGVGLLAGPAAGGFLFERYGFGRLALVWAPALALAALLLGRVNSPRERRADLAVSDGFGFKESN